MIRLTELVGCIGQGQSSQAAPVSDVPPSQLVRPRKDSVAGVGQARLDSATQVKAADVTLVTSGVSKTVTADQLKEFVTKKGLIIQSCELLTNVDRKVKRWYILALQSQNIRMFKNFRDKIALFC